MKDEDRVVLRLHPSSFRLHPSELVAPQTAHTVMRLRLQPATVSYQALRPPDQAASGSVQQRRADTLGPLAQRVFVFAPPFHSAQLCCERSTVHKRAALLLLWLTARVVQNLL